MSLIHNSFWRTKLMVPGQLRILEVLAGGVIGGVIAHWLWR